MNIPVSLPIVEKRTSCGICEASCGLRIQVQGDRIVSMLADAEHPNSRGFACSKGVQFRDVKDDPDRVRQPLRRNPDGSFTPVSWQEALDDIGARLGSIMRDHGSGSVGLYAGNPIVWNYGAFSFALGMAAALRTKHVYIAASVDINNYYVVNQLLYGNNFASPFPDVARTQFMVILGANPVVSHGSMMTVGHVREALLDVTRRRGRVIVIDPRRTETAALFEYIPIRPDADAWLVAAMVRVAFAENLIRRDDLEPHASGLDFVRRLVDCASLDRAAEQTGIPAGQIVQLTRDFVAASGAAFYGRWGASLGQFSTLTKYLIDVFNFITGNLDRPGGVVFGHSMIDIEKLMRDTGQTGYARWHTRVEGIPEVIGSAPLGTMASEIETEGAGRLRALFVSHGNPAASGPGGPKLERALGKLDLLVAMDPYITETSRLAHYVLPPTLWLERDGFPIFTMAHTAVPYAQWSEATAPPPDGVREDWWILDQICRRVGITPSSIKAVRLLGKLGIRPTPRTLMDAVLRLGPEGDWFGLRPKGLSRAKLIRAGAPIKLMERPPTGVLRKRIAHRDRRIHLEHELLATEMQRLVARPPHDPEYPLRIISMRELRSHNSWLHNVPKLMAGDRYQRLRIHPQDARSLRIRNGDRVKVESRYGAIEVMAWISDEMMPGTLALPHGWGHRGGWRRANAAGGACFNDLTSNAAADSDLPSGQAQLTGICVRVARVATTLPPNNPEPAECHS